MTSDVISAALNDVKKSAENLFRIVNAIDMKHDTKTMEIKNLENKIEGLKKTEQENAVKASAVLQSATEQAAEVKRQAKEMMEEANRTREQAKIDREQAERKIVEAQTLLRQAEEKQRTADANWHQMNEREKKLKAALGV